MLSDGLSKPRLPKLRLLFLAHLLPWPLDGGGQIKSYHTLRILSGAFDITLLSFVRPNDDVAEALAALGPFCVGGIQTVSLGRTKLSNALSALSSLAFRRSFLIARDDSAAMHHAVQVALSERPYAVLHADHLPMMAFVPPAAQTGKTRIVLDNHNVEHRIIQRIAENKETAPATRFYAAREWPELRAFERDTCRRADLVLAVSDEDVQGLQALDPTALASQIISVPIGVDTAYFSPVSPMKSDTNTLLSIGTLFWPPNVDGAQWFCRDILPIIKNTVPNVQLHLVGARPNKEIMALAQNDSAHVHVFGSVPDVRPFAQECGAFIVPLRSGSGMRVKILNAFAMQLPVVSTTLGAEGIVHANHGEHLLLADSPEAFASACVRVLQDRAFAAQLAHAGRRLAETVYSWDTIAEHLLSVYPCVNRGGGA